MSPRKIGPWFLLNRLRPYKSNCDWDSAWCGGDWELLIFSSQIHRHDEQLSSEITRLRRLVLICHWQNLIRFPKNLELDTGLPLVFQNKQMRLPLLCQRDWCDFHCLQGNFIHDLSIQEFEEELSLILLKEQEPRQSFFQRWIGGSKNEAFCKSLKLIVYGRY